uniref:F-box domain-containing protein n=1 Tax=Oryza brachyantha TaxID=4533 RepID=J3LVW6_ORYBR
MLKAEREGRPRGLPEELVVWEILLHLPPKPLLRCRLVCRSWRRLTSTRAFLHAHHRRQRPLPFVTGYDIDHGGPTFVDFLALDRRDAAAPAARLQHVARFSDTAIFVKDSCDGILVLSGRRHDTYAVCNPATRQYGGLPMLAGFTFMGLYQHRPTGEYRILVVRRTMSTFDNISYHVYTLGSGDMPRCIGWWQWVAGCPPVLFNGSLHWFETLGDKILVFDTTAESFRWMRAPNIRCKFLFETDGTLGIFGGAAVVDIWVLQDYEREVWSHKYRVEMPVPEIRGKLDEGDNWEVTVFSDGGHLLLLVEGKQCLLYFDTDGKLLATFQHDGHTPWMTAVMLKQSLVPHAFFPLLEDNLDSFHFSILKHQFCGHNIIFQSYVEHALLVDAPLVLFGATNYQAMGNQ